MWGVCILLALMLASGAPAALATHHPLSDAQLDRITAGSASPNAANAPTAGADGVVVGGSSTATIVNNSRVKLTAASPGHPQALNVVNASTSLVSNGVNVLDAQNAGRAAGPATQANNVSESQGEAASVDRWSLGGKIVSDSASGDSFSQSSSAHFASTNVIDQSTSTQSSIITTDANVPGYNPFNSVLHIGSIAPNPFTIPKFGFDINAVTGSDDTKFGFAISGYVGPFNVSPGAVDFGNIDLSGPTLKLDGGSITLPSISGAASGSGEICFFACASSSSSGTFNLDGSKLGKIDFPSISLGPNPFNNFKIQAGGGIAGAGSGTMSVNGGSVGVNFSVSLQIPSISGKSLNIGGPVDLGPFGTINIPETTVSLPTITFPSFSTTVPLVNFSLGGFTASFHDAAFCLDASGNNAQCQTPSAQFQEASYHNHSTSSTETSQSSSSQTSSFQTSRQIIYPAVLSGAQGGYLALTGGNLSSKSSSSVDISGPVQQGLNVGNLANTAQSALANNLNVAAASATDSALRLSQTNLVSQNQ